MKQPEPMKPNDMANSLMALFTSHTETEDENGNTVMVPRPCVLTRADAFQAVKEAQSMRIRIEDERGKVIMTPLPNPLGYATKLMALWEQERVAAHTVPPLQSAEEWRREWDAKQAALKADEQCKVDALKNRASAICSRFAQEMEGREAEPIQKAVKGRSVPRTASPLSFVEW